MKIPLHLLVMMNFSLCSIPLSPLHANPSKSAEQVYQNRIMAISRYKCQRPQQKKYRGLTYELCVANGRVTYGYGDGPPEEAGPSFYLKNGKLLMFTETGTTVIYLFKDGELEAEVSYTGTPTGDKLKTSFTLTERAEIITRAKTYTNSILKVFGRKL